MLSTWILKKHLIKPTTAYYQQTQRKIGIIGEVGVLIHNYLPNRQKFVTFNGRSSEAHVRSGAPHGVLDSF